MGRAVGICLIGFDYYHIDVFPLPLGAVPCCPIDLHEFPKLKHVRVRFDFLMLSRRNRELKDHFLHQQKCSCNQNLFEALPRCLEQLELDIECEPEVYEDKACQKMSIGSYDLIDTLDSLALHKGRLFPNLKKVALGKHTRSHRLSLAGTLDTCVRGIKMKAAFAEAAIDLLYWKAGAPSRPFES